MRTTRQGFTIIEVLISMVVLVIALFSLSSLQTFSIGSNTAAQRMTIAAILAQDKIEELKTSAWDDPQLADTTNNFVDTNGDGVPDYFDWSLAVDHTNADGPGGTANPIDANENHVAANGYTRTWNVADDTPARNMKTISVRVDWSFKGGHYVVVDSIIAR
jgi:prepilin-type N-terminal cleavage/methylation domain-containing protein